MLVEARRLAVEHRPQSDDPDYWNVWTHATPREVNWEEVVKDLVSDKAICELEAGDEQ